MAINQDLLVRILAENKTATAFGQLDQSLNRLRGQVIGVVSALAGGLALRSIIQDTRAWGNAIDKLQDELGGTAEQMSNLNFIARSVGLQTDELSAAFSIFNRRIFESIPEIQKGTSVFDKLGIKLQDTRGEIVPFDEALRRTKERFKELGQTAAGTTLLTELFGRSGRQLSDFLSLTDDQMRELIADQREWGLVLSKDGSDRLQTFNRNMYRFELQVLGLKMAIGNLLLPVLNNLLEAFRRSGAVKSLTDALNHFAGIVKNVWQVLTTIWDTLKGFLGSVGATELAVDALILALARIFGGPVGLAIAALVLAFLEVKKTIDLVAANWDTFVLALKTGQLNDIPVFGLFFRVAQEALEKIEKVQKVWNALVLAWNSFEQPTFLVTVGNLLERINELLREIGEALVSGGPLGWLARQLANAGVNVGGGLAGGGGNPPPGGSGSFPSPDRNRFGLTPATGGFTGEGGVFFPGGQAGLGGGGNANLQSVTVNAYVSGNITESADKLADMVGDAVVGALQSQRQMAF